MSTSNLGRCLLIVALLLSPVSGIEGATALGLGEIRAVGGLAGPTIGPALVMARPDRVSSRGDAAPVDTRLPSVSLSGGDEPSQRVSLDPPAELAPLGTAAPEPTPKPPATPTAPEAPSSPPAPHPDRTPAADRAHPREAAALERLVAYLAEKPTGLETPALRKLAECILQESHERGIDPALVLAVIHVESRFKPRALSHAGAIGLMQLLPATAQEQAQLLGLRWRGSESLYDPLLNVQLGIAYVERLRDRFGDLEIALAAYNAGPTRVSRRLRGGRGIPEAYRKRVLATYEITRLAS